MSSIPLYESEPPILQLVKDGLREWLLLGPRGDPIILSRLRWDLWLFDFFEAANSAIFVNKLAGFLGGKWELNLFKTFYAA
jgi:hypothetical protein